MAKGSLVSQDGVNRLCPLRTGKEEGVRIGAPSPASVVVRKEGLTAVESVVHSGGGVGRTRRYFPSKKGNKQTKDGCEELLERGVPGQPL